MAARIPVKAIYSGSDVTSLGEFTSSDTIAGSYLTDGSVTAAKLAADTATQAELDTVSGVANAALPKAGGEMTGNVSHGDNVHARFGTGNDLDIYHDGSHSYIKDVGTGNLSIQSQDLRIGDSSASNKAWINCFSDAEVRLYHNNSQKFETTSTGINVTGNVVVSGTVDGVDIQTLNTTAGAALPKGGGTMTGNIAHAGTFTLDVGGDLILDADGGGFLYKDGGTEIGRLFNSSNDFVIKSAISNGDFKIQGNDGGSAINALVFDMSEAGKATFNSSVVVGANAVGTMTTDNDGSFAMSASNNFKCTPSGNFTLTFTSIVAQSGNILLINSGGHTVSAHANTKVDAKFLATISSAGTYLLAYFSDGTNVYMTNSAVYTQG